MNVREMVVTNADGKTGQSAEDDLIGQIFPALLPDDSEDMYHFYAIGQKNAVSLTPVPEDKKPSTVTLMRPVGGQMEGIYRFPHVGEKVLVLFGDNGGCYLMGYLPNAETSFTSASDGAENTNQTLDKKGFVLRYQNKGESAALPRNKEDYSEIAFYTDKSPWKKEDETPQTDKIRISSTGDVQSYADNANQIGGRRIVLQSQYLYADTTVDDGSEKIAQEGNISGDLSENILDLSEVSKGDVVVQADHRVIINAREGIELNVGASSITIEKNKISLSVGNLDGEESGDAQYTTDITLTHKGMEFSAQTLRGFIMRSMCVTDAFDGEISLTMGRANVSGTSVSLGACSTLEAVLAGLGGLSETVEQLCSIPLSQQKYAWTQGEFGTGGFINRQLEAVLSLATRIGAEFEHSSGAGPAGGSSDLISKIVQFTFNIVSNVRYVLENELYAQYDVHYDTETKKFFNTDNRMAVTMAFATVETILQLTIYEEMLRHSISAFLHAATISLTPQANIVMDSKGYYQDSTDAQMCRAVAAGVDVVENLPIQTDEQKNALKQQADRDVNDAKAAKEAAENELQDAMQNGTAEEIAQKQRDLEAAEKDLAEKEEKQAKVNEYTDQKPKNVTDPNQKLHDQLEEAQANQETVENNPDSTEEEKQAAREKTDDARKAYAKALKKQNSPNKALKYTKAGAKWAMALAEIGFYDMKRVAELGLVKNFINQDLTEETKKALQEL